MKYFIIFALSLLVVTSCQTKESGVEGENAVEAVTPLQEEKTEADQEHVKEPEVEEDIVQSDEENTPKYQVNSENWKIESIQGDVEPVLLLTIDDAPDKHSVEMAKTLQQLNINAIFFVNGHFMQDESGKEKLKEIHEMGFEIGNHTMTHANMGKISADEQRLEILEVNDLVEEVTGERPRFYRAPFGVNTETSTEVVEQEKMTAMNWTYGYDWEKDYQNAQSLADIMINSPYLTEGANLLMHDRTWTAEALPTIIDGLKEKGFTFVDPKQIN